MGGVPERERLTEAPFVRITETRPFEWPWLTSRCLAIITGASGGGGGGGGAFCMEGLNLYGSGGGGGGGGGQATRLTIRGEVHVARGGDGGGGGGGGGLRDGEPASGGHGRGCSFGSSEGGTGARPEAVSGRVTAHGGDGGRGFPGETLVREIDRLAAGDILHVEVGTGGAGGTGGGGFEGGSDGGRGPGGEVFLVPLPEVPEGSE